MTRLLAPAPKTLVEDLARSSGSHAPAWEQVLTLQRHQAWLLERPR